MYKTNTKKFKKTYVEITNICNLECEFCPKTQRSPSFMERELFEKVLIQMQGRTKFLYLHVKGEPLLHPELGLFLDLCQKYGFRINITTNGTLIDRDMDFLIEKMALRQLNISLHSFGANDNQYSMDTYLEKIFRFIQRALKVRPLQFCLRLWNLTQVLDDKANDYVLRCLEKEFNLRYILEDKLTPCNGIKLAENIFLNQAERFDWPSLESDFVSRKGFCYGLREQVAFLVDGSLVPCCLDGEGVVNFGNIKTQDFEDIMKDKRASAFNEGFSKKEIVEDFCQRCSFRTRFKF